MSTLLSILPIIAGNVGPAVSTIAQEAERTILVSGVAGTIDIEASYDGIEFCTVATFFAQGDTDSIVKVAAPFMRVDATNGAAATVCVMAEEGNIRAAVIPPPTGNGPGAALDISLFGPLTTVFVTDINGQKTSINIEISCDGNVWSPEFKTFTAAGCITKNISARFIRAVGNKGIATVGVSSQDAPGTTGAVSDPVTTYVFRPEAVGDDAPGGNVYTDWALLYAALQSTKHNGLREIWFDSSFSTQIGPRGKMCVIPAGTWDMTDVIWRSKQKSGLTGGETNVTWDDFAYTPNLLDIEINGNVYQKSEVHSPLSMAFSAGAISHPVFTNGNNPLAKPHLLMDPAADDGTAITFHSGAQLGAGSDGIFSTPAVAAAPMFDAGDRFVYVNAHGVSCMQDNTFMASVPDGAEFGGYFYFVGSQSAYSGGLSWQLPGMINGFSAQMITNQGIYPRDFGVRTADFDAWDNRVYHVSTEGGPFDVQAFDAEIGNQSITLIDETGHVGLNPVTLLPGVGGGPIQSPTLNRPFQRKTWKSSITGEWYVESDAAPDHVTDLLIGDGPAWNNSTNVVDTQPEDAAGSPDGAFTVASKIVTLTDSTANFDASLIGKSIVIAGATTPANNGTFPITGVPDATHIEYSNIAGVAEAQGASTYDVLLGVSGAPTGLFNLGGGNWSLNDISGPFTAAMVGLNVVITGAVNPVNNGTFPIIGLFSAAWIDYTNPAGVQEDPSGWTYDIPGAIAGSPDAAFTLQQLMSMVDSTAAFTNVLEGKQLTIALATSPGNDGVFTVVDVPDATHLHYINNAGVAEAQGNSTYAVDGSFDLVFPTAVVAGKGSKITMAGKAVGPGTPNTIGSVASGGNTIIDPDISLIEAKTWQSDGVDTWLRVSS